MDKNNLIGFGLIGLVLVSFIYFNQPDPQQIEAQKRYQDSIAAVIEQQEAEARALIEKQAQEIKALGADSTSILFNALNGEESFVTLANEKLSIRISTLGGRICSATLADYNNQEGQPVTLFSEEDNIVRNARRSDDKIYNQLYFTIDGKEENIDTRKLYFTPVNATDNSVVMRLSFAADKYIDLTYRLLPDSYVVDLSIEAHNTENIFSASTKQMNIVWEQILRQQEKGFTFEQQYTSLTYKTEEDIDHLNERSDDSEKIKEPVDWVAFKNQFFSCIMVSKNKFDDVVLESDTLHEGKGYMKTCIADMSTPFDPTGKVATDLSFYFGPNKFSVLKESNELIGGEDNDLQLQRLIYFGWPIVRWINRFFIMYLFDWLTGWGMSMGLVLLLLTLIVKAIVYPFTYKSYVSSAKMRALKPYIDEINAKYPKQEDAMRKQQEIMMLYSKYGASPMGGCLPMLIQMPIFIAMFNFVPNAIELRQQSFLWANDLSTYDAVISWGTSIWPIGNHISLFCLLFCLVQIANTYYTSKMQPNMGGSPEQAQQMKIMRWMMYFMPIMFFFIFNDYSAGLNYYYFLSTLISVGIFIYLRYKVDENELLKKMEAYYEKNKNNPTKRTNFMANLEAMQKELERRNEELKRNNNK
ncbi:MAG: membrane protein insertase YidC [Bacteroidaceae bacterium]|nr:membrane protein insertase YidC [Bacteroidaceae bacterium]